MSQFFKKYEVPHLKNGKSSGINLVELSEAEILVLNPFAYVGMGLLF